MHIHKHITVCKQTDGGIGKTQQHVSHVCFHQDCSRKLLECKDMQVVSNGQISILKQRVLL